ncbi:MAG: ATP-grasp domain-containing protein [Cyclobacteriaceae bacterium]|nr:ATP-grasp domain-containing protein [Cyclobacteriaceae bacterium]
METLKLTIAVTGLNAVDSPGPGVGVIRSLRDCKDFDVRIIGLSYEALEPGLYMHDIVDKSYQIPYPSAGSAQLKSRLEYIHEKEKLDAIIPTFDAELANFIKLAPTLKSWGIATFIANMEELTALDKMHLFVFGEKHGFKVPKTKFISSIAQIEDLEDEFDFPMVVKGKYYEAYIAHNKGQIESYFHKLNAKWGLPVVIQEFIKGTEIVITCLADGTQLIGAIPLRKLYITDKGKGWSGVVLEDDALIEMAKKFAKDSKWKGGFELELMRSEDDELYIMEVNPRFPAWIYTAAAAGQNHPAALIKIALGQKVKPFKNYEAGKMFVRYSWDLITDISEFQQITTTGEL